MSEEAHLVVTTPTAVTVYVGNQALSVQDLTQAISVLPGAEQLAVVRAIVAAGKTDQFREVLAALEIMATTSNFNDPLALGIFEGVATDYPFTWWLEHTRREPGRDSLIAYWDFFRVMAADRGHTGSSINPTGQQTTLWKATGNLAVKMLRNPGAYCYLPAILVNSAEQVAKKLAEIVEPKAFFEVLVGEAWEDMAISPKFLGGISTVERKDTEGCVATLMICLQM